MSVYELFGRLRTRDTGARRISTGVSAPVLVVLLAAMVFLLIGSLSSDLFAELTVKGIALGSVFASLALALVLIYRATGVINFAQGEMAMATTYVAYQLTVWGVSYWPAFFATLAVAFVFGVVTQQVVIRPVQHRSVVAAVIVTVGLFSVIDGIVIWIWNAEPKFMPAPFSGAVYQVGGEDRSRVAADRHERAVADRDLSRIARDDVQAEYGDEVQRHLRGEHLVVAAEREGQQGKDGRRDGARGDADAERAAHTFLTAARPNSPDGLTSRTTSSTANATGRFRAESLR